jgi:hypothetical protein
VCVFFVRKDLYFRNFNISRNCKEKDLEFCAVELKARSSKLIILTHTERLKEILINL